MEFKLSTLIKVFNVILALLLTIFSFFSIFTTLTLNPVVIIINIYQMIFGALLFLSIFSFKFINDNLFLIKSTKGKGFFNLFLASTFMISDSATNIVLCICFAVCGLFFIFIGFKNPDMDNPADITKGDVAKKAYDNKSLLGDQKVNIGLNLTAK